MNIDLPCMTLYREMKLTSPRLNMVIAVGGIVWFTTATVTGFPTTDLKVATVLAEVSRHNNSYSTAAVQVII